MTKNPVELLPYDVRKCIEELGQRLRTARVRRRLSVEDMAQACGVSRKTVYRIESGESGIALGTLMMVLYKLGLLESMQGVANSDDDEHGKILEAAARPLRVRAAVVDNDF